MPSNLQQGLIKELEVTESFINKTLESFTQEDALYRPQADMYTVTSHIDHTADSVRWFIEGAFLRPDGFDLAFEEMIAASQAKTDFDAAIAFLAQAFSDARDCISKQSDESLYSPLPEGPIMAGAPRLAVISGIVDHTAHHRGSLAVYARLLGRSPAMPYA